jgi:hypothetical protein
MKARLIVFDSLNALWRWLLPGQDFYAFDLLRLNGKDLQGLPIEERKAKLEALLIGGLTRSMSNPCNN